MQVHGGATRTAPSVVVSSSVTGPANGVLLVLEMVTTNAHSHVATPFFVQALPVLAIFRFEPGWPGDGGGKFGGGMGSGIDSMSGAGAGAISGCGAGRILSCGADAGGCASHGWYATTAPTCPAASASAIFGSKATK